MALNNFKGAGEVITVTAGALGAVGALQEGVAVSGSGYIPLIEEPMLETTLASIPNDLTRKDAEGFTYQPASGDGDALGITGGSQSASSYPFEITNPPACGMLWGCFRVLKAQYPAKQSYLDAFNAVRNLGALMPSELQSRGEQLDHRQALAAMFRHYP